MIGNHGASPAARGRRIAVAFLIAAAAYAPATMAADDDEDGWHVGWKNGFVVESADGDFALKFGGRVQADWMIGSADDPLAAVVGDIVDGNEFRRARVFFEGVVYERIELKAEYDFAEGEAAFKDVYIGFLGTPAGDVRVGHFKEPFSLEQLTSSKYIAFLERSLPDAFAPARNTGIMLHDDVDGRITWAVGAFREADDFGNTADGEGKLNVTGRVTGLPLHDAERGRLLHLGLSLTNRDLGRDTYAYAQRPEAHLAPRFVDTGTFDAEEFAVADLEVAGVAGPFWGAAELMTAMGDAPAVGDPDFRGASVQGGWFLTGESRPYKRSEGVWDRVRPARVFGAGPGAWEVLARWSRLDLDDAAIAGGEVEDWTLGLNWYPNPVTRAMLNWVRSERADVDGAADILLLRLAVDF